LYDEYRDENNNEKYKNKLFWEFIQDKDELRKNNF